MKTLPVKANAKGRPVTVAGFLEAGRDTLALRLVAGGNNIDRVIEEPIVNRPGLALTGFYTHFAAGRLQLIGKGEMAYLKSLPHETRIARLKAIIDLKATCFVFTNGQQPDEAEKRLAEEMGAVILVSPLKTRLFAGLATFELEKLAAPTTSIYGTMVEVCGLGVLFEGDPGLGKSETALGLIKRGCALVADDLTCLRKAPGNNVLFGSASDSTAGYMEIRGIGIMHIPSLFGVSAVRGEKRLHLIITFKHLDEVRGDVDRIGQTRRVKRILDVDVPNIMIPVSEGRDLVNLVETAAMQQKLLMSGGDPVFDLSERLRRRADSAGRAEPRPANGKRKVRRGNGG